MLTVASSITDWLTAGASAATAVVAFAALLYAHFQLRGSHHEAQIQNLLTFCNNYVTDPIVSYRSSAAESFLSGEEDSTAMHEVANFFETLGLLVDRGYLNECDVWEMFSYAVLPIFESCKRWIEQERERDKNIYTHFESLYRRSVKLESKHGTEYESRTVEDLKKFWLTEKVTKPGRPLSTRRTKSTSATAGK